MLFATKGRIRKQNGDGDRCERLFGCICDRPVSDRKIHRLAESSVPINVPINAFLRWVKRSHRLHASEPIRYRALLDRRCRSHHQPSITANAGCFCVSSRIARSGLLIEINRIEILALHCWSLTHRALVQSS